MSIRHTLIGLLIFLTGIVTHASYTSLRVIAQNDIHLLKYSEDIVPSLRIIAGLQADINHIRLLESEYLLEGSAEHTATQEAVFSIFETSARNHLVELSRIKHTAHDINNLNVFRTRWERYLQLHRYIKLSSDQQPTEVRSLFKGVMGVIFNQLSLILSNGLQQELLESTERITITEKQHQAARSLLYAGFSLGLIVCCCATAYAIWGVSRPLTKLSRAMKRLAEDESDVELPSFGRHNEIGQIAHAVQRFKVRSAEKAEVLQEARRAAESASQAKANFIASMSHEIRTPLNGVLGMAQSLFADDLLPGQRNKVSVLLDSGSTLLTLLNDVLDFSKIDAGKLEIVPVDGDLRSTIISLVHLFQPGVDEKSITLTVTLDPAIPERLNFDPGRVRQCVGNLLSNAIKFTSGGGRIELGVTCASRSDDVNIVTASVTDTGIGMTPETVAKLFLAFTQADDSISRRFGGSGLGLAISRRLAQAMGGDIDVTSELGIGSCFRIAFTAAAAAPWLPASNPTKICGPQLSSTVVMKGARVLLVDDNAVNRMVVKLFLAPYDVQLAEAVNGKEALEKLRNAQFDVVLLDVHMPVMDGCETIRAIRMSNETWSGVPTIALTADAMSGDRERYLAMGMTDYLSKPIDQRELLSRLTSVIAVQPQRASMPAASAETAPRSDRVILRAADGGFEPQNGSENLLPPEKRFKKMPRSKI